MYRNVTLSLSLSLRLWPPDSTLPYTSNIIGNDPYFPAAMRQPTRDSVSYLHFSFLLRDLGCPNSPSVSSRASTIPLPSSTCSCRTGQPATRGNSFRNRRRVRIDGVRMTNSHRCCCNRQNVCRPFYLFPRNSYRLLCYPDRQYPRDFRSD